TQTRETTTTYADIILTASMHMSASSRTRFLIESIATLASMIAVAHEVFVVFQTVPHSPTLSQSETQARFLSPSSFLRLTIVLVKMSIQKILTADTTLRQARESPIICMPRGRLPSIFVPSRQTTLSPSAMQVTASSFGPTSYRLRWSGS